MVEAVRSGTIFASGEKGQRQYDRWRSRSRRRDQAKRTAGLTGAALEGAVRHLWARHPEYVAFGDSS